MKMPPDAQLVSAAQAGDKTAFVDLVARYQGMVTGIALAILGNFQASEDAAQETFITAWKKLSHLREGEKLRSWLAQIARNTALMSLRKTRLLPSPEKIPGASEIPRPDEVMVEQEEHEIVLEALNALPEKLRLPLVLFYREDQSIRKVSDALNLTPDIVKKRLSKGRALLGDRVIKHLGPVMRATGPGTIFTTTVAGLIGATMKPSAMAATAISGTHKTTATTAAAMTTSKLSIATTVLALGLCFPAGYQIHHSLEESVPPRTTTQSVNSPTPSHRSVIKNANDSPLVTQWNEFKAQHLTEGLSGYATLYQAIQAIDDPLQREAFTLLGLNDWTRADPQNALLTLAKPDPVTGRFPFITNQIIDEWLRFNPGAALVEIERLNIWEHSLPLSAFEILSKGDPRHLIKAFSISSLRYESPDSIMAAANRDFSSTFAAIDEILTPPHRGIALSAIARQLAETDPAKAREWIDQLPPEDQTYQITPAYIHGLVTSDPDEAFRELNVHKNTLSGGSKAKILVELSKTHFSKALSWAEQDPDYQRDLISSSENPFANYDQFQILRDQFTKRLREEGPAFLEQLQREGFLDRLTEKNTPAFPADSRDLESFSQTWQWLKNQDPSPGTTLLEGKLIASAMQHNPQYALQFLQETSDHSSYSNYAERSARAIMENFSNNPEMLRSTIELAPPILLEKMVTDTALDLTNFEDLTFWQEQLQRLPPDLKPSLVGPLASAMTQRDPVAAARWIDTLPTGENRNAALKSSYHEWARSHPEQAGNSLRSLVQIDDFNQAATGYLAGLAQSDPEIAQTWLHEIGPSWEHYASTAENLIFKITREEPDLASQWIDEFQLDEVQKENLTKRINNRRDQPESSFAE
jgi:RNA polymerase sigma factor (sigma-70 family)